MGNFRNFIEVKMGDATARAALDKHPLRSQSTFGVEIEFLAWNEEHAEMVSSHGGDYGGIGSFNFDEEKEDDERFVAYYNDIYEICNKSGYRLTEGNSGQTVFGLGLDGKDVDYHLPVIELRTCPLPATQEEFTKFEAFLTKLRDYVVNSEKAKFTAHTGLHIHVSNPKLQGNPQKGEDIFAKLSAAVGVDEEKIWDDLASSDRNFERFALLNHHEDFEGYGKLGVHAQLVKGFDQSRPSLYKPYTRIYTAEELTKRLDHIGITRNIGTNFNSRNPTVEYRYLSSMLLEEKSGVQKVMGYVKYFINQTLATTNKNQIKFQHENQTLVFTRLKDGLIRMDLIDQEKDSDIDRYKPANVRTGNVNNNDARKVDKYNRPAELSMQHWKKVDPSAFAAKYGDMSRKTNWKYNVNTKAKRDKQAKEDDELLKSLSADYQ